jgi:HK97 family phage major capsid protein
MSEPLTIEVLRDEQGKLVKAMHEEFEKNAESKGKETTGKLEAIKADVLAQNKRIDEALVAINRPPAQTEGEAKKALKELTRKALKSGFRADNMGPITPDEMKALAIFTDPTGGYLCPPDMVMEIIKGEVPFSPIRALARVIQTTRNSVKLPVRVTRPGTSTHSEGVANSEDTNIGWGMKEVYTKEYKSTQVTSNELLEDSAFNIEEQLTMDCSYELGVAEATDFVTGVVGTDGTPEGLCSTSTGIETVDGGTSSVISPNDPITLYMTLKPAYRAVSTWVANAAAISKMLTFRSDTGNYLWGPGLNGAPSGTLLGRPVVEAPDMSALITTTAAKVLMLGDFRRGYVIVDRIGINLLRNPYSLDLEGQIRYTFRKRTGGKVVLPESMKILTIKS